MATDSTTYRDENHRQATPGVLRTVAELGAAADERTAELDAQRSVPNDLYQAAAAAGLFRALVPRDLGGVGGTPLEWFRTGLELARHEASFGWVVTQGAAELAWVAAGGDDTWAREVLADPLGTSASTSAGIGSLTIEGACCRFSGTWAFNTGSRGATWVGGLAVVDGAADDAGDPVVRWAWVPADRAEVLDDWDAAGLRGTGSHSMVIAEQEIPYAWTFSPGERTSNDRGPYRCLVGNGGWPIAASVAATQLGNSRRALDEATRVVADKAPPPAFVPLARNPAVQRSLVRAEGLWGAGVAVVERELVAMWAEAEAHGELSAEQRVRLHRANVTASALALQVVDLACEVTGTTAVARRHVLSRCQRDAHALRGHLSVNGAAVEHNASVAFGLEPESIYV